MCMESIQMDESKLIVMGIMVGGCLIALMFWCCCGNENVREENR
jgi:hypothetical protein